ncbi:FTR1 family iron permease [Piscirickettsia litoralis]|uniref:Iron permease n=1 Tax=Piscirickettsia litoralis TaxID=1891921 RepID=A0ABX3A2T7_9GAMM|nr:FTR1 family protein [Piscirickettsia litoralis]ODN43186.1 hypothetical protein BGC07_09980 [Piscirickettsia litoralis]
MLASLIIVFREVMEMAIIISVLLAATQNIPGRKRWINIGIISGIGGAFILALLMILFSSIFKGASKQVLNAIILFAATGLIAYTVIWMKQHSQEFASRLKSTGQAIISGQASLSMLSIIVGLAILREGSEIILFLYSIFISNQTSIIALTSGALIGLALGLALSVLMYQGFIRLPLKQLFTVTSILLAFIAAGLASKATGKLISIDALPAIIPHIWDTSALLSDHSLVGKFFAIMFGYNDQPSAMQLIIYLAVLAIIFLTPAYLKNKNDKQDDNNQSIENQPR